jgi:hypothetical protein
MYVRVSPWTWYEYKAGYRDGKPKTVSGGIMAVANRYSNPGLESNQEPTVEAERW